MTNPVSKDTSVDSFSGYPSSALDGASRRISAMYENIISADEDEDEGDTQAVEENLPVMDDEQGSEAQLSPLSAHLRRRLSQTRPDNPGDMGHKAVMRTSILSRAAPSSWPNDKPRDAGRRRSTPPTRTVRHLLPTRRRSHGSPPASNSRSARFLRSPPRGARRACCSPCSKSTD